jgi:hypothetical protein
VGTPGPHCAAHTFADWLDGQNMPISTVLGPFHHHLFAFLLDLDSPSARSETRATLAGDEIEVESMPRTYSDDVIVYIFYISSFLISILELAVLHRSSCVRTFGLDSVEVVDTLPRKPEQDDLAIGRDGGGQGLQGEEVAVILQEIRQRTELDRSIRRISRHLINLRSGSSSSMLNSV